MQFLKRLPGWGYAAVSYTLLLCAVLSTGYPAHLKRQRAAQTAAQ